AGQAGLIVGSIGFGAMISQPLGGWLTDRFGAKPALIGGMLATAVCLTLVGVSATVPTLLASGVAFGIVGEIYRPAAGAIVAVTVAPRLRAKAYGLNFWALNLGFAVGG